MDAGYYAFRVFATATAAIAMVDILDRSRC